MAIFKNDPATFQRLDYRVCLKGWISLYWRAQVLEKDIGWFKTENFKIVDFDCSSWTGENNVHDAFRTQLNFPDYYGDNLNALNDCLSYIDIPEAGIVLVFRNFQVVRRDLAHSILDIIADNSRKQMLFGKKQLAMVQVDQPNYQLDPVGACPVSWNETEWLNSSRGVYDSLY